MASNKTIRVGPIALTNTLTTNLLNPPVASGGVNVASSSQYLIIRHIRVTNKTGSAATVSMWIGASAGNAAGTEFAFQGTSVAANSYLDWYGILRLDAADFLVGGSGTSSALSFEAEGEAGIAG